MKAELNGDKEVGYMILQLVQFFRLNVKSDSQFVTIAYEVKLIQSYMNIICYRYSNIQFISEVDPGLNDIEIPNFLLQPLVENAVLHGLRDKGYNGVVRLSIQMDSPDSDYVIIKIYDNGVGFTPSQKEKLFNMLNNYQSDEWKEHGETHIGVLNVQKRLKMYYPKECGLTYLENPEGGITAQIIIKKRTII